MSDLHAYEKIRVEDFEIHEPLSDPFCSEFAYLNVALRPRPNPCTVTFPSRWASHREEPIGRIFFLPPQLELHGRCPPGSTRLVHCLLDPDSFQDLVDIDDKSLIWCLDIRHPHIVTSVSRIVKELQRPDFGSNLVFEAQMTTITIDLIRILARNTRNNRGGKGGLPPWRLRLIEERLYADLPLPTLTELAALCQISTRHLARCFQQETGETIARHIRAAGVERANSLLAGNKFNLKQIASKLGFATSSSFALAYKHQTGVGPRTYRDATLTGL